VTGPATWLRPVVPGLPERDRSLVMGVINVTPDSFSDGRSFFEAADAIEHGRRLLAEGADILDVGGESTRPGAGRVPVVEELRRVLPVVRELARAGAVVSIDTMRAGVAEAALAAGAGMVNDVSGGLADPEMVPFVAGARVPYVLMHWRGHSADMQSRAIYGDVVAEVVAELRQRLEAVIERGMDPEYVLLDPGLGFAKTAEHNWALLAHLDALRELGRPLLVAASRKAFLGRLLAASDGTPRPLAERDDATTAVSALAAYEGVFCIRTHRVRPTLDAVMVTAAWIAARMAAGAAVGGSGPETGG
jgi:dihydropteroate synthase